MEPVDIVFAGSGIACTTTLIELFRKLIAGIPNQRKISITVIEKHNEFWLGIPYGSRSSANALTITSIADFFTAEKEWNLFLDWFKLNKDALFSNYLKTGGLSAEQWLSRNEVAISKEDWKNLYLPRFMVGIYLNEVLAGLLTQVKHRQLVQLDLINAEVTDAKPVFDTYQITVEHADKTQSTLTAKKLVIATGSAPAIHIKSNDAAVVIDNFYEPGFLHNINTVTAALSSSKNIADNNVLIVGSNASSIELLYTLAGLPQVTGLINKLVIVSRSGLLPYHIIDKDLDVYPLGHLDQLKADGNYSIEMLVAAAMQDIRITVKDGVVVQYFDKMISYIFELMAPLDDEAKQKFIGIYGMQISNLFRRSGPDYKYGEAVLHQIQKLTLLKGAFVNIDDTGKLGYADPETNEQKVYDIPFKVVINCTGSDNLERSNSSLIYGLVNNNIARVNLSGKGFYVNEKFEAAPNLYIMGPLLGGNRNDRIHFWHLENASRLMYLAPFLADCLLEE